MIGCSLGSPKAELWRAKQILSRSMTASASPEALVCGCSPRDFLTAVLQTASMNL
jgi:hypothetical protein